MPVRISYSATDESLSAAGIEYAGENGAKVISFSYGWARDVGEPTILRDKIDDVVDSDDIVFVAPAGNDDEEGVMWPAAYSNTIAVGASNQNDLRKEYNDGSMTCEESYQHDTWGSNYGSEIDVVAPGVNIWTTARSSYTDRCSGTLNYGNSFGGTCGATAHVAGVAGMIRSINSSLTWQQVRDIIRFSADDLGAPGKDNEYGYGRVNAYKAALLAQGYGNVTEDITWYYDISDFPFSDDVVIQSGVKMVIKPGVNLSFSSGAKLEVNGTLEAIGTSADPITFDKSGSNGWYGIVFEDPSDDNASAFEHCEVSNASYGIKLRKSSVNIKNCTFSNCSFGIYTWNSESDIHDNSIYNCGSRAMYIYHSNCWIEDNTIYGEYAPTTYAKGIHIKGDYDNEDPIIAGNLIERCKSDGLLISFSSPYIGYNEINENQGIGLKADLYGNPEVEENEILSSGSDGMYIDDDALPILAMGCNAFEGNTGYHVNSDQLSAINASINWWGQSPPNSGKINGNVQYSTYCYNYYCTSWGSGLSKALAAGMTAEEIAAREQLEKGYAFQCEKLYSQAVQEFEAVVAQYPETEEAILALVRIPVCYRKLDRKNDVFSYMESVADDNQDELLGAMALSINVTKKIKDGDNDKALKDYEKIVDKFMPHDIAKEAMYGIFQIYFEQGNEKNARKTLKEFEKEFPDDDYVVFMKIALGDVSLENLPELEKGDHKNDEHDVVASGIPDHFDLVKNHPNPFNPITRISFELPEAMHAKLEIFNILGQQVAVLVDREMEAGRFTEKWDGHDRNGKVGGGLYLCRFTAGYFSKTIKMTLLP